MISLSRVFSWTYAVKFFRNFGASRLHMTWITDAGTHPPGFTATITQKWQGTWYTSTAHYFQTNSYTVLHHNLPAPVTCKFCEFFCHLKDRPKPMYTFSAENETGDENVILFSAETETFNHFRPKTKPKVIIFIDYSFILHQHQQRFLL